MDGQSLVEDNSFGGPVIPPDDSDCQACLISYHLPTQHFCSSHSELLPVPLICCSSISLDHPVRTTAQNALPIVPFSAWLSLPCLSSVIMKIIFTYTSEDCENQMKSSMLYSQNGSWPVVSAQYPLAIIITLLSRLNSSITTYKKTSMNPFQLIRRPSFYALLAH